MPSDEDNQIEYSNTGIKHESAGGFVFYEDQKTHELFVALLRNKDGQYLIPKGHLKKNETSKIAAIREVKEELSLKDEPKVIAFLGVNSYTFTLDDSAITHYKNVHLFVFQFDTKVNIQPQKEEGFTAAEWIPFEEAVDKISFDKENLLKARQSFYFNKPIRIFNGFNDVQSIVVAIPTYNGSATISNTLTSVLKELALIRAKINKKVVICIDHCTDNTADIVKRTVQEKKSNDISIDIIENDGPQGKTNALNKIFEFSSEELFCVIDDDVMLAPNCLTELIKVLVFNGDLRCVFSVWKRLPLKNKTSWKLFWHWILGVKFDIQPYDKPSDMLRGACMMLRRESFVRFPPVLVLNEDQFLQYIYWPKTKEVKDSIIYFNSVSSISDYYRRFVRIAFGSKQMFKYFAEDRVNECLKSLYRKVDYRRIMSLPWRLKYSFMLYRFIRFFVIIFVSIRLNFKENYEWFRFKQD